ncbi:MAG: hypothetical protein JWR90_1735 [Marmoricola sp.]|jgi:hypothetical protein|nr:hypothetical protein [Marmoricola sp.]
MARGGGSRVVLHVGAMKSGTTYLQSLLWTNRELLAERGVLFPGRAGGDQMRGVMDVLGHAAAQAHTGAWQALADEIRAHDGTSVISMEFLGPALPEKVDRVLAGFEDVTVVVTARDLNRNLAAMWQESVQNGRAWTFADFVEGARVSRPHPGRDPESVTPAGKSFWRQQNLVRICRNWSRGGTRLVLVTVPPPGAAPDVLRDRFLSLVGTPADGLVPPPRSNESIGVASAEALRQVNALLETEGLAFPAGQRQRKNFLADTHSAVQRGSEARIGLPLAPWVEEHAAAMVAKLQTLDVELLGDWDELRPVAVPGVDPGSVDPAAVSEAAVAWLAGVVARQIRA